MAKRKATARKSGDATSIEIRTYDGLKTGRKYLLIKGRRRGGDFFEAFAAVELKEAALDIASINDTTQNRESTNSNDLARSIWYPAKAKTASASS